MSIKYKNIFYFKKINSIGGVETFFYYLAKKYNDWDITVFYQTADLLQLKRLRKYVRVKQYNQGDKILCEKAFFCYNADIIDNVDAKEYIQIIHADYEAQPELNKINSKIDRYIGVSQLACDSFTKMTGLECELCYNPVEIDEPEKSLLIVSATRLTKEKGKDNIIKIANKLNAINRPYKWLIFTNDKDVINIPNIIYKKPNLEIINYLKKADIVAQLSSCEAFGFTPNEALLVGTPVLLTDLPIWKELGIKDGIHGWIIKDIDNFDVEKLFEDIPEFKYIPPKDNWDKILEKGDNTYKKELEEKTKVVCIKNYFDTDLNILIKESDEPFELCKPRAEELIKIGVIKYYKEKGN